MNVAGWYWIAMGLMLLGLWLQERLKLGTKVLYLALHLWGMAWIRMMRHTGQARYTHVARRHR